MKRGIVILLVVFLMANALVTAWALYSRFSASNEARKRNAQIWHVVVCDIEQATIKSEAKKRHPDFDLNQFLNFYDHLLVVDVHAAPCGLPRRAT